MPLKDDQRTRLTLSTQAQNTIDTRSEPIRGGLNRSDTASQILERYEEMMTEGRKNLPGKFSLPEIAFLLDVLGQTAHTPESIRNLFVSISDALPDYAGIHGITDGASFLESVKSLTPLECYALVDALQRFSAATARDEEPQIRAIFQ